MRLLFLYLCAQNNNLDMKIEDKLVASVSADSKRFTDRMCLLRKCSCKRQRKSLKDTSPLWYSLS